MGTLGRGTKRGEDGDVRVPKNPFAVLVGKRLRELRDAKGTRDKRVWSQADVASALHCAEATYQSYEAGDRTPPPDVVVKLADFYEASLDCILRDAAETPAVLSQDGEATNGKAPSLVGARENGGEAVGETPLERRVRLMEDAWADMLRRMQAVEEDLRRARVDDDEGGEAADG